MTVELTQEQIQALLSILDQTAFRGADINQAMALYSALTTALKEEQ